MIQLTIQPMARGDKLSEDERIDMMIAIENALKEKYTVVSKPGFFGSHIFMLNKKPDEPKKDTKKK